MTYRRFRTVLIILIGALVFGAVVVALAEGGPQAASPEALLGRAQHQQDVESDFNAAIATYKQVIASPKAPRALVAKALLLMGTCYEQLGNVEAKRAYERIIKEFSDVGDTASAAKGRLASLNAGTRTPSSGLAMRRIYDGPGLDWCNGLSSNFRYLSHPDWKSGNIAVADLTTGQVRRVTTNGTIDQSHGEFGECTIFSPDDKQIAFFWQAKDGAAELRIIGLDGSGLRTVYRDTERTYLQPLDWSPDGRSILVELSEKNAGRLIAVVSTSDGALRALKHGDSSNSAAQFSPDGRFIAYSTRTSADSSKRDLFVMAADGSGDTNVMRHPADDYPLGWAPDGGTVFFASDRTGSYGVWSIGVESGRPQGPAVLVKADVGKLTPVRMLNGTLYYEVNSVMAEIYLATVDPATGKALSPPAPIKPYFSGPDFAVDWSPDGKSLAYQSIRGGSGDPLSSPALVSIFTLDTGQERQVRPALDGLDANDGPRWSPDGRSLLVIARQMTPEHGAYKVAVDTGATTLLVKAPKDQYMLHAVWGRDGRSVFYTIGNPTRIVRRDLATGRDTDLVSLPDTPAGAASITLSPDGQWLAFKAFRAAMKQVVVLSVIPADGGATRELCCSPESAAISSMTWAPDGRSLWFTKTIPPAAGQNGPPTVEAWRSTPDGRIVEKADFTVSGKFSPDGHRAASTKSQSKSELWALENLAPAGAIKK